MSKVIVSVEVEKELNEIGILVCSIITKLAKKVPIGEIAATELVHLEQALAGLENIEVSDLSAVQKSFMLPIADMVADLLKKTPVPAPATLPVA